MRLIVLGGAGIIGRVVVRDLVRYIRNAEIVVGERDLEKAEAYVKSLRAKNVQAVQVDAGDREQLARACKGASVVASCVRHDFNVGVMQACLQAKAHYVDLGGMFYFTKKELKLDAAFRKQGITGILGIGGAPGISNMLAVYGAAQLQLVKSVDIVFADIDTTKYEQKFVLPYSFKTLLDEYMMQPAVFQQGRLQFVKPESGKKVYDFGKEFGKQAGFLTLHSELATLPAFFKNKGIQRCEFRVTFPSAFSEVIESLIALGFASEKRVRIGGKESEIREMTARLMDQWIPKQGTRISDKELVRVILNDGEIVMDAITESDGIYPAGVLDTGVPCAIACQQLASGTIQKRGVFAPETAIEPAPFFAALAERGIVVKRNGKRVN